MVEFEFPAKLHLMFDNAQSDQKAADATLTRKVKETFPPSFPIAPFPLFQENCSVFDAAERKRVVRSRKEDAAFNILFPLN